MLYEGTPENRRLLVGYNEGRFAKDGRYLVLPKGSIDEGETPLRGALREFGEETGFDLAAFLGEENIGKLERGETLRDITNPSVSGVTVVKFSPRPYPHTYHARTGKTQSLVMFGVRVEGIDRIPNLKNSEGKTTKQHLDAHPLIPRFPVFLAWMKQGFIPADGNHARVELWKSGWFDKKVKEHASEGIEVAGDWQATRARWQHFCQEMERDEGYKKLRAAFGKIKQRMVDLGHVEGDKAVLKFDGKDCPLFWYSEGAMVGNARDILAKTLKDMKENPDYARAFGGQGTNQKELRDDRKALLGQVAGYSPFVSDAVWRAACKEANAGGRVARSLAGHGRTTKGRAVVPPKGWVSAVTSPMQAEGMALG
ncbi:MAG: NUDIX domain-containing protein [Alphaproteobacteria bacterium]|nr:NUDIX domain-containing protein [Alphaproteobacteria bacterium]